MAIESTDQLNHDPVTATLGSETIQSAVAASLCRRTPEFGYVFKKMLMKTKTLFALLPLLLFLSQAASAQESNATRERRAANGPMAEATVTINEQFLNSFLTGMFDNLNEPTMALTMGGAQSSPQCASEIRLKREISGTRTAVHFENGKIAGSLAFAGAYNASLMGCIEFTGWADTDVNLDYDSARRAVVARFHVRDVHLNNTPPILNGPLLAMVQGTIDRKYNPVELFTLDKLSTRVEIQPAGGALQLRAREVRTEVTASAITLVIIYDFVKG